MERRTEGSTTSHHSLIANRKNFFGASGAGLIVIFFCLILLWHDPLVFWNDDYELSILPVFADIARSWSEGHLPLLSPYSWVCSNLAGEFQYGTFSIFINAAVILIWKFSLSFPQQAAALSITHLFVLAAGAFLLARDRELSAPMSIFVALVAALNGWIVCWGATDWFGALGAFAWFPWAWWGLERALNPQRTCWRFLWPAPFVYLVVTGGFPYTVLMLVLLIAWLCLRSLIQRRTLLSILPLFFGAALGFGLSAPAWLAAFAYVHGSARELQPSSAHWQWLVPPAALPGFILPCWKVKWADFSTRLMPHAATELSCGVVATAALISAFVAKYAARDSRIASPLISAGETATEPTPLRKIRWELGLLLLVLAISMLPSAGVFRWSFRWLPFFHLILALCAAAALHHLGQGPRHWLWREAIALPGVIAFVLVALTAITMSILHTDGPNAFALTWIFLGLSLLWAFSQFFFGHRKQLFAWTPACVTFASLMATYFCLPLNCGVPKYNLDPQLLEAAPLDPQRLYLSIYPPAEHTYRIEKRPGPVGQIVRPGSTSMWGGLHFINGYSPILAAGVARDFKFAIHGEMDPDFGKHLLTEQAGADGILARVGVDGIAVASEMNVDPLPAIEWQLVASTEEGRVFHRRVAPFARVRSVTSIDSRPNDRFVPAHISRIVESRNHVEVDVDVAKGDRTALLTFSRPYFRGYVARIAGEKIIVDSYRSLFPTVELPAGSHGRLVLTYRPLWLVVGGGLSILCAVIFVAGVVAAGVCQWQT